MNWLFILALTIQVCITNGVSGIASCRSALSSLESNAVQEASEFVAGLSSFNSQILDVLKQQSTKNVIVIPFSDFEGKQSRVSAYFTEEMVTAIVASKEFKIQDNSQLVALIEREKISPMMLAANESFRGSSSPFDNTSIIVGTITDLQKKVAVMARIIQGKADNYAGAAIVYLRIGEEIRTLLAADRSDALIFKTAKSDVNNPEKNVVQKVSPTSEPISKRDSNAASMSTVKEQVNKQEQPQSKKDGKTPNNNPSDQTIYDQGRKNYIDEHYERAIALFNSLVQKYPESPLADNAYYWIGESFYMQKNWKKALEYFQKVLDEYPYGNKVPAAILKRGYTEEQLGHLDNAIATMEELIRTFSDSPEAGLAKNKLRHLRSIKR